MNAIVIAIGVVASLVAATTFSLGGDSVQVTRSIVAGPPALKSPAYAAKPRPGYIDYAHHDAAVPAPGCRWTRLPIYDAEGEVVGWRGRPVAVCP